MFAELKHFSISDPFYELIIFPSNGCFSFVKFNIMKSNRILSFISDVTVDFVGGNLGTIFV